MIHYGTSVSDRGVSFSRDLIRCNTFFDFFYLQSVGLFVIYTTRLQMK